jgi:lysophospholipase L1-like esterase
MRRTTGKTRPLWLLAKFIFAAAYLIFGGEIFLRVLAPEPMLPRYVRATEYGIRGNEPNRSYWHTTAEYRINIRTNSNGIRADREIPYEKPKGVKRIILLGDSFGMGYGVDLEDTFSSQMQKALERAGVRSEVVNLSVSGHGTAEQLITLRYEGLRYQPDFVLIAWHTSDRADNVRANLYGLENDQLVRRSETYLPGVKTREFLFQFAAYRLLADHSHLYNFARERTAHLVKYRILPGMRSASDPGKEAQDSHEEAREKASAYRNNLALALLGQIEQECASNNASLLILDVPRRRSRTEFRPTFPYYDTPGRSSFNVFCPVERFEQYKGEKLYWEKSHGHFTPLGCRVVGEGLAEYILESGCFDDDAPSVGAISAESESSRALE